MGSLKKGLVAPGREVTLRRCRHTFRTAANGGGDERRAASSLRSDIAALPTWPIGVVGDEEEEDGSSGEKGSAVNAADEEESGELDAAVDTPPPPAFSA